MSEGSSGRTSAWRTGGWLAQAAASRSGPPFKRQERPNRDAGLPAELSRGTQPGVGPGAWDPCSARASGKRLAELEPCVPDARRQPVMIMVWWPGEVAWPKPVQILKTQ